MGEPVLVPVAESITFRQTVGYAVETALQDGADELHLVFVVPHRVIEDDPAFDVESPLDRATVWARTDADGELTVRAERIGGDEYLFSPSDYAETIAAYAHDHGIRRIVIDPEYDPGVGSPVLRPLEYELTRHDDLRIEEAPVEPRTQRPFRRSPGRASKYLAVFGISYLFYLVLGDPTYPFDLVTGAISAGIVALALARVTFAEPPHPVESAIRLLRWSVYVPYLLFEIVKANVAIAYVILHPRMPIEPRLNEVRAALWEDLPVTTLANSITLTPGTLSVRVRGQQMIIHSLTTDAREDLFDGGLERAVRYVFYGREAARIATPEERGDAEVLNPDGESVVEKGGGWR